VDVGGSSEATAYMILAKISNGTAVVPLYTMGGESTFAAYSGNDTITGFDAGPMFIGIDIFDVKDGKLITSEMGQIVGSGGLLDHRDITNGKFSSGNMTVNWGNLD
jgi:hypothetical protein